MGIINTTCFIRLLLELNKLIYVKILEEPLAIIISIIKLCDEGPLSVSDVAVTHWRMVCLILNFQKDLLKAT